MQGDDVEIVYFGLLPEFIGLGLGGTLLTAAIERAFGLGAARAWVHTCSLDHPQALGNYLARGMRVYRTEVDHGSAVRRDWCPAPHRRGRPQLHAVTPGEPVALPPAPPSGSRVLPRPMNGIFVAITVMKGTLASSGRLAM